MKPRLLLADDHALVLEGLCTLLERDFEIVGTATEGRELLALAKQTRPDAILVDISMPNLNGIEAMRQIRMEMPEARIIVLTQYTDPHYVQAAFRAGASGYVVKQSAGSELRTAVHQVLAGRFYLAPAIAQKASGEIDPMMNPAELFGAALTTRQREVLQLVAEGKSAKEIALILSISPKTVEFHKASLMDQIGLRTTAELTRYALDRGIVAR